MPAKFNAFVYVFRGAVETGGTQVPAQRMAILKSAADSDGVVLRATEPARALLIAGLPLNEPIAQHGPFVMNTRDELIAAVRDYQAGKFSAAGQPV
jgi:redox-sensitive bicupin YhaK (pirin superfamily)